VKLIRPGYIFLFLIVFFVGIKIFPQSGLLMSVYGHIIDLNTNKPLPNISIIIFKIENEQVTDVYEGISDYSGFFKVRYLKSGKYRFMVEIPDVGIVHILIMANPIINDHLGAISSEKPIEGDYNFEIKEGRNSNLNIFLKEDSFPNIEKVDENEIINFTMHYRNNYLKQNSVEKDISQKSFSASNNCPGLTIEPNIDYKPVGDSERIMYNGKECAALSAAQVVSNPHISYQYACQNNSCIYRPNTTTSTISLYVKHHSVDWIKDTWQSRKNMVLSDQCASCLNQSYIEHELYHLANYPQIAQDEWCQFLNRLSNSQTNGCCARICKDNILSLYYGMIDRLNSRVPSETETGAWVAFRDYYTNNCNQANNPLCAVGYPDILIGF
jgi:hypothetical protein